MANYQRVTLSTLKSRLAARTDGVSVFWPSEDLVLAINEALNLWQSFTGSWTTSFKFTAVNGGPISVPTGISSPTRVLYNGVPLTMASMADMDRGKPGWLSDTGTPAYWIPQGINQIFLSPAPASGVLTIEGYSKGPTLQAEGDFINIGDEELTRILEYAEHYLSFKEGMPELQSKGEGYTNWIAAMIARNGQLADSAVYGYAEGMLRDMKQNPTALTNPLPGVRADG